jgi:cation:H+ antiporter
MVLASVLALAGLVLLTIAADHLVLGASRLAALLRIAPVVVGVVVIGLGTSAPEFLVSGVAAAQGDMGIATGNIVGSNILNVTLILGVAALIANLSVSSSVIRREIRLSVAAVIVFAAVMLVGLTWQTGAVLAAAALAAVLLLLRWARRNPDREVADETQDFVERPPVLEAALGLVDGAVVIDSSTRWRRGLVEASRALVGLAGVLAGAQLLVVNASSIATRLGVPQVVIGVTLVALGTSLPELITTVVAQRRRESDLVVGNLFGSNLFNSLAGGAVIGLAGGSRALTDGVGWPLVAAMVVAAVASWLLLRRGSRLTRIDGAILLALYLAATPLVLFT